MGRAATTPSIHILLLARSESPLKHTENFAEPMAPDEKLPNSGNVRQVKQEMLASLWQDQRDPRSTSRWLSREQPVYRKSSSIDAPPRPSGPLPFRRHALPRARL